MSVYSDKHFAELRTQHRNDLDYSAVVRSERKLEQMEHLQSRLCWMFCNAELADSFMAQSVLIASSL